jgi:glyoxylase-like metal-dependent hydrolase (beta-lactamase superfamily II)
MSQFKSHFATAFLVLIASLATVSWAQRSPGYVDPEPVLRAAEQAIGVANLKCVTFSGTGYAGAVGQQKESGHNIDWPRLEALSNYTRTINWDAKAMVEEFDRKPGLNPASWKHGAGWKGGTPLQQNAHQKFVVNGNYAWHVDGPNGRPVAAPPDDAERWQLDMWLNPPGFLKAARMPGANPKAFWRWELGESGRDGATTVPEKVTEVSIVMFGKYRVDATVNKEHMLQRIHTWVPDPVLGDMNYEHEFTNENYVDLGNGIRFPTVWHHHDGWDDNYGAQTVSAAHNGFGGQFKNVKANACPAVEPVPESVRQTSFAVRVESQKLADGVYLLGGTSHNSVAVEFKDFIAVVEAPLDEKRNLAVIDEIVKLIPNKPIRFLVNTHQHFDHIGGLRTYMHIGATIITHQKNWDLYTHDVLNYSPRTLDPDLLALAPPTELTEGYQYETVRENYRLSDGTREMHISYVQPLAHVEGMLMAYLPKEKIAIEADLFGPPAQGASAPVATPANKTFYNHVQRLQMDVATIAPIHGKPTPWSDFLRIVNTGK